MIELLHSPHGGTQQRITQLLRSARRSILLMMYELHAVPLMIELQDAARRGLSVQIILDKTASTPPTEVLLQIKHAGGKIWQDAQHKIHHNKVCVIDSAILIMGSYNWTQPAEADHAESTIIIEDPVLCATMADNFRVHQQHSLPLS
jgi:phosphatidylserine/phosphatidylglycerophosphate/cardiolipin synthase-like enzyme